MSTTKKQITTILLATATLLVVFGLNGCDQSRGAKSVEALVSQSLEAFMRHDTTSLVGLLVDHDEFTSLIYPGLGRYYPAARDTACQAREFVWENQSLSTLAALRSGLRDLGGEKLDLVAVEFTGGEKSCDGYTLHEGTRVKVRREDGTETTLHTMGSVVEMDGRYKFLTYRDRD